MKLLGGVGENVTKLLHISCKFVFVKIEHTGGKTDVLALANEKRGAAPTNARNQLQLLPLPFFYIFVTLYYYIYIYIYSILIIPVQNQRLAEND